jgi:hypothetical protein
MARNPAAARTLFCASFVVSDAESPGLPAGVSPWCVAVVRSQCCTSLTLTRRPELVHARQCRQPRQRRCMQSMMLQQHCYEITASLMLLDRDTRRGPRTRVLAVITRRSAHCSLLPTHKPGSPLLPCLARTPVLLAQVLTHCSIALNPLRNYPPFPKSTDPYSISRSQI